MNERSAGGGLPYARAFWDRVVYQKVRALQKSVFLVTQGFPNDERFGLVDQFRRAVRSIGAQIAEAWGRRSYEKHFISKLNDAESENLETQHWIITCVDAGHMQREVAAEWMQQSQEVGRILHRMSQRAEEFCTGRETLREDCEEWYGNAPDPLLTEH